MNSAVCKKNKKYRKKMYVVLVVLMVIVIAVAAYMSLPKFGRAPRGERLGRIERSENYRDGSFQNQIPTPMMTSDKGRAGAMFDFLFKKYERTRPDAALPVVKTDLKKLPQDGEIFVWFGHSSYFIQSGGKRILVDPVFESASPVPFFNKPFPGADIYKTEDMPDIDYLIITHDHWDHLDYETVTRLKDRVGRVICPLGVGEYFEYWGFDKDRLVELDWDEEASLGDGFTVYCLPSRHFSGRTFRSNRTLWASFLVSTATKNIYIGGDGGYDGRFAQIARRFPVIDVALVENGQYNRDWKYIHTMPEELGRTIRDLNPRKVFAVHNSKYALAKHPWDEPLNNAAALQQKDSLPLCLPMIGQVVDLNTPLGPVEKWWKETPGKDPVKAMLL